MAVVAPRSKLLHAIVVVGLSTASAGCGSTGQVAASNEAGADGPAQGATDTGAPDAPSEVGSVDLETDAFEDAGIPTHRSDAGDAAPDCSGEFTPGPEGGCWPLFV
jgi:hypothetical protein